MEYVLVAVGLALQLVGAYVTYRGFRHGWNEAKSDTDRFFSPAIKLLDRIGTAIAAPFRRLLRMPKAQKISTTGIATSVRFGNATLTTSWGPVPGDVSDRKAIEIVNERLKSTVDDLMNARQQIAQQQRELAAANNQLNQRIADQDALAKARAVSSLRVEALGFMILTLGSIIQATGTFFG